MSRIFRPVSESKHLIEGSLCPETPKILRLYSMKFCPYAQRTRLVLAAKKIENEVINIHLFNRPKWIYNKSPLGKVPCLEFPDGRLIYESLITCDFLDTVYPGTRPLNSKDPFQRAKDQMLIELFNNKVILSFFKLLYRAKVDDESSWKKPADAIMNGVDLLEKELSKRGSLFFGGNEPGMLDYMVWPWMERLPATTLMSGGQIHFSPLNMPHLARWFNNMKEDEAVQESYIAPENHHRYFEGHKNGNPDYDMVLK